MTISYLGFQLLLRDKEYRQRKLFDSWDFRCSCSQCGETRRAQEEGKLLADIRKLMKSKLRASETLDFSLVAEAHAEIVELVQKLTCASLLMPQFAKDLADAGHLARLGFKSFFSDSRMILLQRAFACPERHEIVEGNFGVEKVPQVTRNVSEPREKVV